MNFGNSNFEPPTGLQTEDFLLRPLRASDAQLDYEAVMESREFLRKWEQSTWPADDFTLAENLADLQRHEREHNERISYTFTVMNPTATTCLGCVYIFPRTARWLANPDVTPLSGANWDDFEATIHFWVRLSGLALELDRELLEVIRPWFAQAWSFDGHLYIANGQFAQQVTLLDSTTLQQTFTFTLPKVNGRYIAYS